MMCSQNDSPLASRYRWSFLDRVSKKPLSPGSICLTSCIFQELKGLSSSLGRCLDSLGIKHSPVSRCLQSSVFLKQISRAQLLKIQLLKGINSMSSQILNSGLMQKLDNSKETSGLLEMHLARQSVYEIRMHSSPFQGYHVPMQSFIVIPGPGEKHRGLLNCCPASQVC